LTKYLDAGDELTKTVVTVITMKFETVILKRGTQRCSKGYKNF